jgi:hypothetical protein
MDELEVEWVFVFVLCRHDADWTAGRAIRGSNPGGDKRFVFTSKRLDRLCPIQPLSQCLQGERVGGGDSRGVRLTTPV